MLTRKSVAKTVVAVAGFCQHIENLSLGLGKWSVCGCWQFFRRANCNVMDGLALMVGPSILITVPGRMDGGLRFRLR